MLYNQDRKMVTSIIQFPLLDISKLCVYTWSKQISAAIPESRHVFIEGEKKKKGTESGKSQSFNEV